MVNPGCIPSCCAFFSLFLSRFPAVISQAQAAGGNLSLFQRGFLKKESSLRHHPGGLDAAVQLSTSALKGEGEMATAGGGGHGAAVPRGTCLEEKPFSIISTQNLMMSACVVSSCAFPRCLCICLKRKKKEMILCKNIKLCLWCFLPFLLNGAGCLFSHIKSRSCCFSSESHTHKELLLPWFILQKAGKRVSKLT